MIEIQRIDHISQVVANPEQQVQFLQSLFGFEPTGWWEEQDEGYRGVNLAVPGRSGVGWEVLGSLRSDSFVQRFLDSPLGPGLHHVTFDVADVRVAANELRALHLEPWGAPAKEGEPLREVFVHPRDGHGFLFQLASGTEDWHGGAPLPGDARGDTLGIVAINHLSHAHPRREELAAWYEEVFGFYGIYAADGSDGPFATAVLETPTQQMRWEVLQPHGAESFVQRFLETRGPSMHHVTFQVGDWQRAVDACTAHGVPIFGERAGVSDGARWREAFIHPRHTAGVLVQFFWEEKPGVWI